MNSNDNYSSARQASTGVGNIRQPLCDPPPSPRSPMEIAMSELAEQRSRLESQIVDLRQRLDGVIPSSPQTEAKDPGGRPTEIRSTVVTQLHLEAAFLESCNRRLFAILRDLEL